jgi:type VI secretion system secreted protein VgrG
MPEAEHTLTIDGLSTVIRVLRFEGHEGLSQLFEMEVTIGAEEAIDPPDLVRKDATLTFIAGGSEVSGTVSGIVARVEAELIHLAFQYRITIVPKMWLQLQGADSRIFQDLTVPEIVDKVLKAGGLSAGDDYSLSLTGSYVQREYCVQYRESNWDFVCRLLEEEGIYFYFDQTPSGHKAVFADTLASETIAGNATMVYRPEQGVIVATADDTRVVRFHFGEQVRAGKVSLRDWNFLKPSLMLDASTAGKLDVNLEVYDYPGEYLNPGDGTSLTSVRLDELEASRKTGGGATSCSRFTAGHKFTLSDHPREAWNASYLITRVEHFGVAHHLITTGLEDDGEREPIYRNAFEVVLATVLPRPQRVTRRPQIHGVQTAIVVGPAGEEIYVDVNARVKVQFHWDRLGKNDDKSSCWVRVAQSWASASFGAMFLPRVNDEVVVAFIEGDPDRPLIVGSVYHGTNVPPYALPGEKTKSTIKSNSSKGGGGSNELRFEDKKGSEEVYVHAQKDWTIAVENDKNQTVGHDETLEVGNDRTKTVKHDQTGTIQNDDTLTVQHDQKLTVQNDRSVTVQNDHTESVTGNQSITVGKAQTLSISDKQEITVTKTRALTVSEDVTETLKAKLTRTVTGDVSDTLKAKRTVDVTGDDAETIGGKQSITIKGDSVVTVSGKHSLTVTGDVTITSGSSTVTIKPSGEITVSGSQIKLQATGPLQIQGATVDVKSDGPLTVKAPVIQSSADGPHTVKGAMITLDGQMVSVG